MKYLAITSLMLVSTFSQAQEFKPEYRLLGPAFTKHLNSNGQKINTSLEITGPVYSGGGVVSAAVSVQKNQPWEGVHPAIGLEYQFNESNSAYAMIVRDSYFQTGAMAGLTQRWNLFEKDEFKIKGGFAGGLWYRSVLTKSNTDLEMKLVPYVMPTVRFEYKDFGLDLSYAPKIQINGRKYNETPTYILQLNYKI